MRTAPIVTLSIALALFGAPREGLGQSRNREPPSDSSVVAASSGQIWVKVYPPRLVMGKITHAQLEATFPRGSKQVVFFASHGRVSNVAMQSATRATAEYEAPDGYIPRVDIVAALATVNGEKRWGFAAVLLVGQGEAELKTKPDAEATIRIGEKQFGPVLADKRGKATIRVEVPPGVRFGHDVRGRPVDLHVPYTARTAIFAETRRIRLNEVQPVELFGVVVSTDGTLDESSALEIVADRGEVVNFQPIGGGAFTAQYYPPDDREGQIHLEAFVGGDEAPPASIEMSLVPPSLWFESFAIDTNTEEAPVDEPVEAKPRRRRVFLTPKVGFGLNTQLIGAFQAALDFGGAFTILGERFSAAGEVGFFIGTKETDVRVDESRFDAKLTTWALPVSFVASWRRDVTANFTLMMLGQFGYALVKNDLEAQGPLKQNHTITRRDLGGCGIVGGGAAAEWQAGVGTFFMRVRYVWLPGYLESFNGTMSSLLVDFGYRFWLL